MDIKVKWFYRLGFLLLLFIVLFVFIKISPIWQPILRVILTVAFPFVLAAFIAYLLYPFIHKLHENGLQWWLSVMIVYILFFGGIGYGIYKGIPVFIQQLRDLSENLPQFFAQLEGIVDTIEKKTKSWPLGIHKQINESLHVIYGEFEQILDRVKNFFLWLLESIFLILLIPFIAFYMIKDISYLTDAFWSIVPKKWRKQMKIFIRNVDTSLGSYIRGQFIVSATVGTISTLLFWLIKLKYPLLLGAVLGMTNVIPYFGPIIGAVPAVIVAATMSMKTVILVIVIVIVLQFLEGNVLSPLIMGRSLQMHPLMIIFSILIGGEVGGVVGLIFAVPIVAIIKTTLKQIFDQIQSREIEDDQNKMEEQCKKY